MIARESQISTKIPWLGKMPIHWEIMRAKYMFRKESRAVSDSDEVVTCFRDGIVTLRKNRRTTGFTESIQEFGYQAIRKGDLVIHVMDAFAGAVGVSDSDGKGTPVYNVCTAKGDFNNYYYAHVIREMAKTGFIQSLYRGIRQRSSDFRFEIFAAQYLPVPPRSEQDQIVRYLDWQVSRTNKLISALKKQIALLKEQKQVIINEAVTRGLDPSVPKKDSGVEWIGEIPSHWALIRNKNILKEKNGTVGDFSGDFTLLSLTTRGVIVRDTSEAKGKFPSDFGTYKIVESGNIIFCLFDIDETPRTVGLSSMDGMITGAYDVFQIEGINSDYLTYYYLSIDDKKALKPLYKGLRKVINPSSFLRVYSPFPPIEEQEKIVLYLKKQCKKTDTLIENINREITLLVEYRTRLISDVVTGQIDVRDAAVPEFEFVSDETSDTSDDEEIDTEEPEGEEA
ncbi:MAG: restriction endonuclease subunit S [Christensenellales bacterium]|jgi:type I restriction enzyme S subunit